MLQFEELRKGLERLGAKLSDADAKARRPAAASARNSARTEALSLCAPRLLGDTFVLGGGGAQAIFAFFDKGGDGAIDIHEFAARIRGEMKESRVEIIREVFEYLDKTDDGKVTVEDLRGLYDVHNSPDVASGSVSADGALQKFIAQWDVRATRACSQNRRPPRHFAPPRSLRRTARSRSTTSASTTTISAR